MSQRSSILSPITGIPENRARSLMLDEDDTTSSLQALIDILRRPQEQACQHCLGRGRYLAGGRCEHCYGSGQHPASRRPG